MEAYVIPKDYYVMLEHHIYCSNYDLTTTTKIKLLHTQFFTLFCFNY